MGYPKETRGYYFYKPNENKVFVARGGVFLEKEFVSKRNSGSAVHLEEIWKGTKLPEEIQEPHNDDVEVLEAEQVVETEPIPEIIPEGPRRFERSRQVPVRYGFLATEGNDLIVVDHDDPATFQQALDSTDSDKW